MKKKVLFVTYGGGHVNIVRHIYKELVMESYNVKIIALTNSITTLEKEEIPYKTFVNYLPIFHYEDEIIELGEKLAEKYYDINSGLHKDEIVAYLGLNFYDLINEIGNYDEALELFTTNGHKVFNPKYSMKKILEFEKPDIVVLTSSMRVEKATGLAANELHIPVIRILDTIGDDDIIPYNCKVCVMNEYAKTNLMQNNSLDEKNIIISGQPDYEESIKINEEVKNELRFNIKANQFDRIITYIPQPRQKDNNLIMNELIEIARKNEQNLYIVKLHPNEFIQEYKSYTDLKLQNLLITKEAELPYYLDLSDLVLTKFSMGGLYAVFMDKPLIVLNIFKEELFPDYSKYGVAVSVNDISELEAKIIELLSLESKASDKLKRTRKEFNNVENAVRNIVQVIEKTIIS